MDLFKKLGPNKMLSKVKSTSITFLILYGLKMDQLKEFWTITTQIKELGPYTMHGLTYFKIN